MTLIILVAIDFIPGCSLRASEEGEIIGIDEDQVKFLFRIIDIRKIVG